MQFHSNSPKSWGVALTAMLLITNVTFAGPPPACVGFGEPAQYDTIGENSTWVIVADFNGDGLDDIAQRPAHSVSVALNTGDGTFNFDINYTLIGGEGLAAGDINNDGHLDIVTVDQGDDRVRFLFNQGTGFFSIGGSDPVGDRPRDIAVGDLDDDGNLDLVTSNQDGDSVSVLLGNGDGTFATHVEYDVGLQPMFTPQVADFDNDDIPDIATINMQSDTLAIIAGNGDGTFGEPVNYPIPENPTRMISGDFNGDGDIDILILNHVLNKIEVRLNADGAFGSKTTVALPKQSVSFDGADIDLDGDLDVVVKTGGSGLTILLNNGDASFAKPIILEGPLPQNFPHVAVGNLDNAAGLDVVLSATLVYLSECTDMPPDPDFNSDGVVDTADLLQLLGAWGACKRCPEDLNEDGIVDTADLLALLGAWG